MNGERSWMQAAEPASWPRLCLKPCRPHVSQGVVVFGDAYPTPRTLADAARMLVKTIATRVPGVQTWRSAIVCSLPASTPILLTTGPQSCNLSHPRTGRHKVRRVELNQPPARY